MSHIRDQVITIEDDDDIDVELSHLERRLRDLRQTRTPTHQVNIIDLTQDERQQRDVEAYENRIIYDMENIRPREASMHMTPLRNPAIPARFQLSSVRYNGSLIKRKTLVEVTPRPQSEYKWQFLHVSDIYMNPRSQNTVLRGVRVTRQRYMRGLLPKTKNEVCELYDINRDDSRPEDVQGAVEISVTEVLKTRAFCRTNNAFPSHRSNPNQWSSEEIDEKGILVQRWKHITAWPTSEAMDSKKSYSGAVIRLMSAEIEDELFRVPDDRLRNEFRGGIVCGGSFKKGQVHIPVISLNEATDDMAITLEPGQQYTADDMFCGAGGVSRGQQRAGLQVRFACDQDEAAGRTYRLNFPQALFRQMSLADLNKELSSETVHSDFLHQSPPCQVFSPAHTQAGRNDEANVAALYLCGANIEGGKPRIVTGEQTFGLLFDRNAEFFNALVGQYTRLGFSFSWDILKFAEYGVPSIRRRLIWVASCPGEQLPPFPKPTHCKEKKTMTRMKRKNNLPPQVTLRDILGGIKPHRRGPLHDVPIMLAKARVSANFPKRPYDDRVQVGTVTTAGSEWAHPSGKRNFTLRELAAIQGFPTNHRFVGTLTQINRQIGNAFSPIVVETLYRHLRKWLLRQDRVVIPGHVHIEAESKRHFRHGPHQAMIVLDGSVERKTTKIVSRRQRRRQQRMALRLHSAPILVIDDNDNIDVGNNCDYEGRRGRRRNREDVIMIFDNSDPEDIEMIDIVDAGKRVYPNYSRASSRTLSAESLPSIIEMDIEG